MAQKDVFLKLVGARQGHMKGETQDLEFKDHIEIERWEFSCDRTGGFTSAKSGGGMGKPVYSDITITKLVDSSTPLIMSAMDSSEHFPEILILNRKGGGTKRLTYLKFTLTNSVLSKHSLTSISDGLVQESFSINYLKMEAVYQAQDEKGAKKGGEIMTVRSLQNL